MDPQIQINPMVEIKSNTFSEQVKGLYEIVKDIVDGRTVHKMVVVPPAVEFILGFPFIWFNFSMISTLAFIILSKSRWYVYLPQSFTLSFILSFIWSCIRKIPSLRLRYMHPIKDEKSLIEIVKDLKVVVKAEFDRNQAKIIFD